MRLLACNLVLACVAASSAQDWSDLDPTENMRSFFTEQRNKIEKVFSTGYDNAVKTKESINGYFEGQQKKMNEYVDSVKESSKKYVDSYSFLTDDDDPNSRLENPEVSLSVPSIIASHGYSCETHTVVSEGYILNVHRIPRSKSGGPVPRKTVLLQHGLFASSADWIINGPEKALAYVLTDAGYDVWMANIRGNRYSREHAWLSTQSKAYWNFSWHDVAKHDVPAIIDYILNMKGVDTKISYVGHSMGTTILFAMLTLRPEYNDILTSAFALAPVAFMSNIKSPLKSLAPLAYNAARFEMTYGSYEFVPKQSSLGRMTSSCKVDNLDFLVCKNVIFYLVGYDDKQFNKTLLPVFLSHLGTGTSWKTAVHFAQELLAGGNFQQFDYGSYNNRQIYGTASPPDYDLSKIKMPIHLFWAQNDLLSNEVDVKRLYERLPSSSRLIKIAEPEFNHLDYIWAVDAPTLLNNHLLKYLNEAHAGARGFSINIRLDK